MSALAVRRSTVRWPELLAWAACVAVLAVSVASHEMWRDELQAWAIARSSLSPFDLIENLAWERHPPLWHLLLWIVTRVTHDPIALKWIVFAIGAATQWVLIRYAPFRLLVRIALALGYFPIYELGTISRSWSLLILLVVLALVELGREQPRTWLLAVLFGVMSLTEVHGAVLAAGFLASEFVRRDVGRRLWRSGRRGALVVWGGALIAATVVLYLLIRSPDDRDWSRFRSPLDPDFYLRVVRVLRAVHRVVFPVPEFRTDFWNLFILDLIRPLAGLVALATVVFVTWWASKSRPVLTFWIVAAGGLTFLVGAFNVPVLYSRHTAPFGLAILAVFWMRRRGAVLSASPRPVVYFATLSLTCGLIGAAWAMATEITAPFTTADRAAAFIRERVGDDEVVVLCPFGLSYCSSVSMRLDTTLHRSADDPGIDYLVFDRGWTINPLGAERTDPGRIRREASLLSARTGARVAVVYTAIARSSTAVPICRDEWRFDGEVIGDENVEVCMADDLVQIGSRSGGSS